MAIIHQQGSPTSQVTQKNIKSDLPNKAVEFDDEGALRIAVQDASKAETWLDQKQWALNWREIDILYQAPRAATVWENGGTTRANVARFTVAKHVNALIPAMSSAMFYDSPPFLLRPAGPATKQNTVRLKTILIASMLKQINFEAECEQAMHSQVSKGTTIVKWGCYTETKIEKKFKRNRSPLRFRMPLDGKEEVVHTTESDEFSIVEREVTRWKPSFEFLPLGHVLVDPGWRHPNEVWRARYVIDRRYLNYYDLKKLLARKEYERLRPTDDALRALFMPPGEPTKAPGGVEQLQSANLSIHAAEGRDQEVSADPLLRPLKCDERWDDEKVSYVIQDKMLVRNDTHGFGVKPFLSANWWDIENAGYGMGVGKIVGSDQRLEAGATNSALDMLSMALNAPIMRLRGKNAQAQQMRVKLGGFMEVDSQTGRVNDAMGYLEPPKVPDAVWTAIRASQQASESATGADEATMQGNLPAAGGSSFGRTATGAGKIAAASAQKIQGPVGRFVRGIFVPFIQHLDAMINEQMPASEIRQILGDKTGEAIDIDTDFFEADLEYEVLAGVHLAAKIAMAQSLPWIIQIFQNPHMLDSLNKTGYTIDIKELFEMICDVSQFRNEHDLVRLMTEDEKKMYMQLSQTLPAKQQGDMEKIKAQGEIQKELIDQKSEAKLSAKLIEQNMDRANNYVDRQTMEHAQEPFAEGRAQYSAG